MEGIKGERDAEKGPAEGDRKGHCIRKWLKADIFESTLLRIVFQKCASHRRRGAHFWKKWKIIMQNKNASKNACCSLHFWCKNVSRSVQNSYVAFGSATAIVFWKSQNQPRASFGGARRNAQGRWGEIWGGLEICRFEFEDMDFECGSDTPAPCHTARAADSIAPRIPPGRAVSNRQKAVGNEQEGRGKREEGLKITKV